MLLLNQNLRRGSVAEPLFQPDLLASRCISNKCPDLHFLLVCAAKSEQQGEVRRRAGKGERSGEDGADATEEVSDMKDESVHLSVSTLAELQSDLNPQDPLQKVVRFSPDMSLLLTGGTDGHVRVWEVNRPGCGGCAVWAS